ncbi:protein DETOXIFICATION 27-like [Oryza brachyantha]|uniref:protein DETOXIFICATION 27-like n=1 Tax=Oryza brachyantha TaxID=4533 RepID=UPI001ADCD55B|nr:protein DETOXIFICATION 27-like [Oryza brachyantha]
MMEEDHAASVAAPLLWPRGVDGGAAAKRRWQGGAARVAAEWWVESKKLWRIVGPAIFQRIALYGINVVSQAFIGHMGDLELAAFSIASTVVAGFNFGFLLGMASALETLCGQAFGAKKYHMLGVYLQRSWLVLLAFAVLLTPTYVLMEDLLLLIGQPADLASLAGRMSVWLLPQHFAMAMLLPLTRFLQSQLKNWVTAATAGVALALHVVITYLVVSHLQLGLLGAVATANVAWWLVVLGQLVYVVGGGCPLSWKGFSMEAFADFWEFIKLSSASGVMLCLENWYYRVLVLLTGYLKNAEIAVDALSICLTINGWEMMIPFGFLAATGVRVANELGAGSGKGARFAVVVSLTTSVAIGLVFWCLIMAYNDVMALLFSSSSVVLDAVRSLSVLLAFTVLLNSVQPVLSGVAIGSGWQALVAYVNVGSYYLVGVPLGAILGWPLNFGVGGIWSGLIGGTAVQTLVLAYLTVRCDWDEEAKKASTRMEVWASTKK